MQPRFFAPHVVLFDLDGTLADTAPDLGGAINIMRQRRQLAPLTLDELRPWASGGARGLLYIGFGLTPEDADFEGMRQEFLDIYADQILQPESMLFAGIPELLDGLDARRIPWGVVTNKPQRFTGQVIAGLGLAARSTVTVSGDTTAHLKPHPASLQFACKQLKVAPEKALYVGDDLRDIQAAQAAGMPVVAAAYGYIGQTELAAWQADAVITSPTELLALLVG